MEDETIENPLQVTAVVVLAVLALGIFLEVDWLVYAGLGLLTLALLSSWVNETFAWVWMKFARMIGTVNSKIILTVIFYLFLTPISLLSRLLRGSPIQTVDRSEDRETYFVTRNKTFGKDDFETPW